MEWIERGSAPVRNTAPRGHWSRLRARLAELDESTQVTALFACPAFGAFLLAGPLRRSAAAGHRLIGLQEVAAASGAPAKHLLDIGTGIESHLTGYGSQLNALTVTSSTLVAAQFNSFGDAVYVCGFTIPSCGAQLGVGRHIIRTAHRPGHSLVSLQAAHGPAPLRTPPRNLASWESTVYPGL
ncbi:hypothetical protein HWD35_24610 [Tsukamurella tyrosinosolvens]|uniref:hypothetical protein n=1 Tax=Tsukamurella TaxID=2060 RepID=UPI001059026B|nr:MULTISPECIES: hypothetical protein [Tsukamurella]MCA4997905.1 hypothetical protein [Tsukamurella tyrosinosolvens]